LTVRPSGSSSSASSAGAFPPGRWVLLDTNALLLPFAGGFPLASELLRVAPDRRVGVPSSVLEELERLERAGLAAAAGARTLAARYEVVPAPGRGDGSLVRLAESHDAWIVTSDRGLRARVQAAGGTVLLPSGHGRLAIAGPRRRATTPTARPHRVHGARGRAANKRRSPR
jgi:rRNA-processing protein FCF1